jgi:hypothetical protein
MSSESANVASAMEAGVLLITSGSLGAHAADRSRRRKDLDIKPP